MLKTDNEWMVLIIYARAFKVDKNMLIMQSYHYQKPNDGIPFDLLMNQHY